MKITKVTLTGADDSIKDPTQLVQLSEQFPFVEWGILLSRNNKGSARFPSEQWLSDLSFWRHHRSWPRINFSGHLCGAYVRALLMGSDAWSYEDGIRYMWRFFRRLQINTHGMDHDYDMKGLVSVINKYPEIEFIFQYDNRNTEILAGVVAAGCKNVSTLFDLSGGAGLLPNEWPLPLHNVKCGYAGGLSPANVGAQIATIAEKVGDREIWIDMETHVRSNNDQLFDLEKCKQVLTICRGTELIQEQI